MADPITLAIAAMAAGTVLSAGGQYAEGVQADKAAKYEADQMEVNASNSRAMSQRQAIEDRRAARLAGSRLQAVSAAGGGAADPTVVKLAQDIDAEGEYNAMNSLYAGEEDARGLEGAAGVRRYEGKQARHAGKIKAVSTVLSSAGSMYAKYGGGGPSTGSGIQSTSIPGTSTAGGWRSTPYSGKDITWY